MHLRLSNLSGDWQYVFIEKGRPLEILKKLYPWCPGRNRCHAFLVLIHRHQRYYLVRVKVFFFFFLLKMSHGLRVVVTSPPHIWIIQTNLVTRIRLWNREPSSTGIIPGDF